MKIMKKNQNMINNKSMKSNRNRKNKLVCYTKRMMKSNQNPKNKPIRYMKNLMFWKIWRYSNREQLPMTQKRSNPEE